MNRYKQLYLIPCLLALFPLLSFAANQKQEQAREYVKTERITEAIALYSQLATTMSDNPDISMEYAYALALSGLHENALMYLDKASRQGADKKMLSFYAAQVFSLAGHHDIAVGFWQPVENRPPSWIAADYILLLDYAAPQIIGGDAPDSTLVRANTLAAKGMYFQSLVLFRELELSFPDSYLPYAGSSLVWEKTGKREIAAQKLDTCIVLMNKSLREDSLSREDMAALVEALPAFNAHLKKLKSQNLLSTPASASSSKPKYIVHANGMLSSTINSLNIGGGWFRSETTNFSANLGLSGNNGATFFTLGASVYSRQNSWVSGYGFNMQFGSGNSVFNYSGSIGYSIFNNAKSRSTDISLIYGFPVTPWNLKQFMVGISIGQSLYFGKRK
jgi:tetratricopeptide (TPR) repeat protein